MKRGLLLLPIAFICASCTSNQPVAGTGSSNHFSIVGNWRSSDGSVILTFQPDGKMVENETDPDAHVIYYGTYKLKGDTLIMLRKTAKADTPNEQKNVDLAVRVQPLYKPSIQWLNADQFSAADVHGHQITYNREAS